MIINLKLIILFFLIKTNYIYNIVINLWKFQVQKTFFYKEIVLENNINYILKPHQIT
jgi:hypothetical protein